MFGRQRKEEPTAQVTSPDAAPMAEAPPPRKKRSILVRLFAVKFWGAVRLTALCVLAGIIIQIGDFTTQPEQISVANTIREIWENTFAGLLWLIRNGWKPALIGATVVLPIWVLWRIVSLPFRR